MVDTTYYVKKSYETLLCYVVLKSHSEPLKLVYKQTLSSLETRSSRISANFSKEGTFYRSLHTQRKCLRIGLSCTVPYVTFIVPVKFSAIVDGYICVCLFVCLFDYVCVRVCVCVCVGTQTCLYRSFCRINTDVRVLTRTPLL